MSALRRFWRSHYLIAVGFALLGAAVAYLVVDSIAAAQCYEYIEAEGLMILCDGPPPTWTFVVTFGYALGLTYLTLRRWIDRPTDDDPAD
jgi:hypothetical protein